MITKFGKSISALVSQSDSYFLDNQTLMKTNKKYAKIYLQQPERKNCKICKTKISKSSFIKEQIPYAICSKCTHLNGLYEDTENFCNRIYTEDNHLVDLYNKANKKEFKNRMQEIYMPKVNFFLDILNKNNVDLSKVEFLDIGAGSGYFVDALLQSKINNIKGVEVSKAQVEFGNKMIGEKKLFYESISNTEGQVIRNTNADIISLVGVLEHVREPRKVLKNIKSNKNIKYVYFSVPLFSPCVFFELSNDNSWHRQLARGHTHLFTYESIKYFCKEFNFEILGEWWFGTDIFDIYRHTLNNLKRFNNSEIEKVWHEKFFQCINELQLCIDQKKQSSEVQMVLKIKR